MTFPAYPAYKDSGVEWLGEVPAHWRSVPLKYLVSFRSGGTPSKEVEAYWDGDVPWASAKDMKTERLADTADHLTEQALADGAATLIDAGAVLVVVRGMILARLFPVCLLVRPMAINQDLKAVLAGPGLDCEFLPWALRGTSEESLRRLDEAGHGTKALRMDAWTSLVLALPPLPEQAAIAAFLDRETAKIDALVAEQERLIELLAEKRRAVVSHAVTKGLDPNAPMKDSGIGWLGEVPAHWKVKALRWVVQRIEQGRSPECLSRPAEGEEWGVLKTGAVNGGIFHAEENKSLPLDLEPMPTYEVRVGDVLMSRANGSPALVGSTGFVFSTPARLMLSDKIYRIELKAGHLPRWFVVLMSASIMRSQIVQAISGADGLANNLPQSSLRAFVCAVPPEREQRAIVAHLDRVTADLDALTAEAGRAVALLKERRTALISAAVTGKIDVRGLVEEAA